MAAGASGLRQDYSTNKVYSVGKSCAPRDVTQGNPLRSSAWGFKMRYFQGRSFAKQVEGAEPILKLLKVASKSLNFRFLLGFDTLSLFHFQVVGALTQVVGAQAHTTEYETTPLGIFPIFMAISMH